MLQVQAQRRRSWAGIVWLSLVAFGALLAAINGYIGILLIASSALLAIMIVVATHTRNRVALGRVAWKPMAQRIISSADGATQPALIVPIERNDGYEMVLTVDGYRLIDDVGRVVYTLKRR
jgi:hypothetical protein